MTDSRTPRRRRTRLRYAHGLRHGHRTERAWRAPTGSRLSSTNPARYSAGTRTHCTCSQHRIASRNGRTGRNGRRSHDRGSPDRCRHRHRPAEDATPLVIGEGQLDAAVGVAGSRRTARRSDRRRSPATRHAAPHLPVAATAADVATEWGSTPYLFTGANTLPSLPPTTVLTTHLMSVVPDLVWTQLGRSRHHARRTVETSAGTAARHRRGSSARSSRHALGLPAAVGIGRGAQPRGRGRDPRGTSRHRHDDPARRTQMSDITRQRMTVGALPTPAAPPAHTTRRRIRLADGRDLFYFDRGEPREHEEPDRRPDLPPPVGPSEVRWDPLRRERVVIAAHRQTRTYKPPADLCPLDPSRAVGERPRSRATDYEVAVFENRFPSFSLTAPTRRRAARSTDPPFPIRPGLRTMRGRLLHQRPRQLVRTAAARACRAPSSTHGSTARRAVPDCRPIDYVFCFENRGEEIGVTLSHPHGQIYGYPFVPPRFAIKATERSEHRDTRPGRCLQCELLDGRMRTTGPASCAPSGTGWPTCPSPPAGRTRCGSCPAGTVADLPALDEAERDDLPRGVPRRAAPPSTGSSATGQPLHRGLAAGAGPAATATSGTWLPRSSPSDVPSRS